MGGRAAPWVDALALGWHGTWMDVHAMLTKSKLVLAAYRPSRFSCSCAAILAPPCSAVIHSLCFQPVKAAPE